MQHTFAIARPYGSSIGARVLSFLEGLGFMQKAGGILPAGTPDDMAARWVSSLDVDLIVVPFHLHRTVAGEAIDGVGLALELPTWFDESAPPILMPVSIYSQQTSFARRIAELQRARPRLVARLVAMKESEIGSSHIARALGVEAFDADALRTVALNSAPHGCRPSLDPRRSHPTKLANFPKTSAMSGAFRAVEMTEAEARRALEDSDSDDPKSR